MGSGEEAASRRVIDQLFPTTVFCVEHLNKNVCGSKTIYLMLLFIINYLVIHFSETSVNASNS